MSGQEPTQCRTCDEPLPARDGRRGPTRHFCGRACSAFWWRNQRPRPQVATFDVEQNGLRLSGTLARGRVVQLVVERLDGGPVTATDLHRVRVRDIARAAP